MTVGRYAVTPVDASHSPAAHIESGCELTVVSGNPVHLEVDQTGGDHQTGGVEVKPTGRARFPHRGDEPAFDGDIGLGRAGGG